MEEGRRAVSRVGGVTTASRGVNAAPAGPWYRQVSGDQWKAFLTTFFAWVLDAFDFTIITFVLIYIQQSFTVNSALADKPPADEQSQHRAAESDRE